MGTFQFKEMFCKENVRKLVIMQEGNIPENEWQYVRWCWSWNGYVICPSTSETSETQVDGVQPSKVNVPKMVIECDAW